MNDFTLGEICNSLRGVCAVSVRTMEIVKEMPE